MRSNRMKSINSCNRLTEPRGGDYVIVTAGSPSKLNRSPSQQPRVDMQCRVVRTGIVRPFFGFNRAKHAVIEAAILATRTHVLPPDEIRDEIDRLTPLIDKTGGPAEHTAFEFLRKTIDDRLASR